ncbi:MAG TPA: tetratricopeptide repeat protein [Deltaproteobacteria bacterium]|nr:tetratricopeptide repeat protein [Deltaproteobacteria bacterium]
MDFEKAFDRGEFLEIASASDRVRTSRERLILGISLFKLGRNSEAMSVLKEIEEEIEHLVKALYYMARIHSRQHEYDAAELALIRYTAFYPDDDEARDILERPDENEEGMVSEPSAELARIYAQQGHYEEALNIFADLLKTSAQDPELKKEALKVQDRYLLKSLEQWLERLKK